MRTGGSADSTQQSEGGRGRREEVHDVRRRREGALAEDERVRAVQHAGARAGEGEVAEFEVEQRRRAAARSLPARKEPVGERGDVGLCGDVA